MTVATLQASAEGVLSAGEARTLTDQIRTTLRLGHELLVKAYEGRAWIALGYATWDAYCVGEFAEARMVRLDREQRMEIVAEMRDAGMSQRAIASGLGISKNTVTQDVSQMGTPAASTIGTDGKTYRPAQPTRSPKRNRKPLPKAWRDASYDLTKVVERLDRLSKDDRVKSNDLRTGELQRAAEMLVGIVDRLGGGAR